MIKTILITGGTGFVGTHLTKKLLQSGYQVHMLMRDGKSHPDKRVKCYSWDVYNNQIDEDCVQNVEAIIHLAGEDIAGRRWTDERKKQIVESRTKSISLIYDILHKTKHTVSHVISASAVGYYGDRNDELLNESSLPGKGFLAETSISWEAAVSAGSGLGLRTVLLRTGVILDRSGGAFPSMIAPFKIGLGIIPGSGSQWVPWIHLQDVIGIYLFALENEEIKGAYNMTAPEPTRMRGLIKAASKLASGYKILIRTPQQAVKMALGEMSALALSSTRTNSDKIERAGYRFKYSELKPALENILKT